LKKLDEVEISVQRRKHQSQISDPINYDFNAALDYFDGLKNALYQVILEPQPTGK
jgi:hypothetical protein